MPRSRSPDCNLRTISVGLCNQTSKFGICKMIYIYKKNSSSQLKGGYEFHSSYLYPFPKYLWFQTDSSYVATGKEVYSWSEGNWIWSCNLLLWNDSIILTSGPWHHFKKKRKNTSSRREKLQSNNAVNQINLTKQSNIFLKDILIYVKNGVLPLTKYRLKIFISPAHSKKIRTVKEGLNDMVVQQLRDSRTQRTEFPINQLIADKRIRQS